MIEHTDVIRWGFSVLRVLMLGILIIQPAAHAEFSPSKYLKTWNATITLEQALGQTLPFTSEHFRKWTSKLEADRRPHRISFEFLNGNRFFMRTPKRLTLYDFSRIEESILIVSRKNYRIDLHEPYETLARKLELQGQGPTKSLFSFLSPLYILFGLGAQGHQAWAVSLAEEWCALVSVLDIFSLTQKKAEQWPPGKAIVPTPKGRE